MTFDMHELNRQVIEEFRQNGGKVGGGFAGAPLLQLTTTGSKTGKKHTLPLVYQQDGDRVLIFGSKGGYPTHPSWYTNLVKNPTVTVEIGTEKYEARAVELTGAERDEKFRIQAERMPNFAEYQAKTERLIPVVALERIQDA